MKTKIANFWWRHAHSLGVWWIVLGTFTISYGIYIIYVEGAKMVLGMIVGIAILAVGIRTIRAYNKREVKQ